MDSAQIDLLKHPLVTSLLDYKWRTYGRYFYFSNLFIYLVFLAFLTAFALVSPNPGSETCERSLYTVEPLNEGHIGTRSFVIFSYIKVSFKNLFSVCLSAGEAVFDGTFGEENPNNLTDSQIEMLSRVDRKIMNGDCSEGIYTLHISIFASFIWLYWYNAVINPRRACAARVTVIGSVCVCVCVCLLSHISPTERLFVLKTLSRTQWATKVKKFVGICLKQLRSRVMPRNMSEKANMLIIPTYPMSAFSA